MLFCSSSCYLVLAVFFACVLFVYKNVSLINLWTSFLLHFLKHCRPSFRDSIATDILTAIVYVTIRGYVEGLVLVRWSFSANKKIKKHKNPWNYILNLRDIKITVLIDMCLISNAWYLSLSLCFSLCRYFRVTACKLPQNVDPQLDLFQKQTFKALQWFSRTVCATMFGLGWVSLAVLYRDFFTFHNSTIFTIGSLINPEDKFNPLFKTILYSLSWVRKLVNGMDLS